MAGSASARTTEEPDVVRPRRPQEDVTARSTTDLPGMPKDFALLVHGGSGGLSAERAMPCKRSSRLIPLSSSKTRCPVILEHVQD